MKLRKDAKKRKKRQQRDDDDDDDDDQRKVKNPNKQCGQGGSMRPSHNKHTDTHTSPTPWLASLLAVCIPCPLCPATCCRPLGDVDDKLQRKRKRERENFTTMRRRSSGEDQDDDAMSTMTMWLFLCVCVCVPYHIIKCSQKQLSVDKQTIMFLVTYQTVLGHSLTYCPTL